MLGVIDTLNLLAVSINTSNASSTSKNDPRGIRTTFSRLLRCSSPLVGLWCWAGRSADSTSYPYA